MKNIMRFLKKKRLYICIFLIFVIVIAGMYFASQKLINLIPVKKDDNNYDAYISVYSGVIAGISTLVGGLFTLVGVLVDKNIEKKRAQDELIKSNIPEIFVPIRYDYYQAIHIGLDSLNKKDDINKQSIRNKKIVIKNSSKSSFDITKVMINNDQFVSNLEKIHICENDLFIFHFNYSFIINQIILNVESIDGTKYDCIISYMTGKPNSISIKETENAVR